MAKRLIATRRILYKSVNYIPGDVLPDNTDMTDAWLNSGSAVYEDEITPKKALKAESASAQAGAEGVNVANGETDETLIGKVPLTETRKKEPAKRKTAKKRVTGE